MSDTGQFLGNRRANFPGKNSFEMSSPFSAGCCAREPELTPPCALSTVCRATEAVVYFNFAREKETHMIIDLGSVKDETKGQNEVTQFREKGTVAGTHCYHETADQPFAKPSACWSK